MAVTALSVKGQIVIPKALREALGLKPGDKLIVLREGDTIILKPLRKTVAAALYGRYRGGSPVRSCRGTSARGPEGIAAAMPSQLVLDSWAILSWLQEEPGGALVRTFSVGRRGTRRLRRELRHA